jgi:hypothetical protein
MADFELEQLKTVLDNMVDSLDHTKGDSGTHDELQQIKHLIRDLQKHLEEEARKKSGDHRAFIKDFFDGWDRNNPLRDLRKAVDDLGKKSDNPLRQGGGGGGKGNDGPDTAGGSNNPLANPADMVKKGTKFAKVLGSATAIMSAVAAGGGEILNFMKSNASAYRSVLNSAEGSLSGIMDMRNTAYKNNMTVEQLVAATQHEGVRAAGAKTFASMQKSIRDFGFSTAGFGMSVQQLQDVTADYMDMSKSLGVLNSQKSEDAAKGMSKLIVINQDMAAMMGKTAEEARQAALKEATDPNFNAAMRGAGMGAEQMKQFDQVLGPLPDVMKRMLKESYTMHGGLASDDLKGLAASSPMMQKAMRFMAEAHDKGKDWNPQDLENFLRKELPAEQARIKNQPGLNDQMAVTNATGNSIFDAALQYRNDTLQMMPGKKGQLSENGDIKGTDNFTRGALNIDEAQSRLVAGLNDVFNSTIQPWTDKFGGILKDAVHGFGELTNKLHDLAGWNGAHPNAAMAEGGVLGALGIAGQAGMGILGGKALWKMGRGMLGRGAGAAAGEAVGAEGAAAAGAGGLLLPALAIGGGGLGMYAGYNELAKGDSSMWSKMKGYGMAGLGGAAAGAGVGSIFGGIGAIPGAVIGGLAGIGTAAWSDWTHPDGPQSPSATNPRGVQMGRPANATGQQSGQAGTPVANWDRQMLDMQHKIHYTLLDLKKASYDQLTLMKQELDQQKANTDRITRLLEESNRNTKQISALT